MKGLKSLFLFVLDMICAAVDRAISIDWAGIGDDDDVETP